MHINKFNVTYMFETSFRKVIHLSSNERHTYPNNK